MGILSKTVKSFNGSVTSVIPEPLNKKNIIFNDADKIIVMKDISSRKKYMLKKADLFLVLPGGLGTLDEVFEVLALNGLNLISKPIIFLDIKNYWLPLKRVITKANNEGFLNKNNNYHVSFIKSIDKTIEFIESNM